MASKHVEFVEIRGDATNANKAARSFKTSMTKSMFLSQLAVQAFMKVQQLATQVIRDAVANTIEYEKTIIQQTAALASLGDQAEDVRIILESQSAALQDITAISDETIRATQTLAISYGVAEDSIDDYIRASISMANVTGRTVSGSLEQLIKTEQGLIDRTLKVIPGIADLTKEQLKAGAAIDLVNEKWGEFIDVKAKGATGELEQLGRAYDDLTESIGRAALEQDSFFKRAVSDLREEMSDMSVIANAAMERGESGIWAALEASFIRVTDSEGLHAVAEGYRAIAREAATAARARIDFAKATTSEGANLFDLAGVDDPNKARRKKKKRGSGGKSDLIMLADGTQLTKTEWDDRSRAFQEASSKRVQEDIDYRAAVQDAELESSDAWNERLTENVSAHESEKTEIARAGSAERQAILDAEGAAQMELAGQLNQVFRIGSNAAVRMFEDMARGQEDAFANMVAGAMKSYGAMVLTKGIADTSMAIASILLPPYTGAAAIGPALKEVAIGAALLGGGMLTTHMSGGYDKAGGQASEPPSNFNTGSFGSAPSGGDDGGPVSLTINVNGAVSSVAVGLEIHKQLSLARQQGFNV